MPPRTSAPSAAPPLWPHCGHGAGPHDPVGCRGIHLPGSTVCLAHATAGERRTYLAGLTPGAAVDHSGTPFTEDLLHSLLAPLRDSATGKVHLGRASFESAVFEGPASFTSAVFEGHASFDGATFKNRVDFNDSAVKGSISFNSTVFEAEADFYVVTFDDLASFRATTFYDSVSFAKSVFRDDSDFSGARFEVGGKFGWVTFMGTAYFRAATFGGEPRFERTTFEDDAWFAEAVFEGTATFKRSTFQGSVSFESATFKTDACFLLSTFQDTVTIGPLTCVGRVVLSESTFNGPATLRLAAIRVECHRTRWASTAEIRLRYATVDLAGAVFEYPLTIASEPTPFVGSDGRPADEEALAAAPRSDVRLASLRGVDAAHLVLADVDLSGCLFTGAVHLDQLRLEGTCTFAAAPHDLYWRHWSPAWFAPRGTLAEEHHWRAGQPAAVREWNPAVFGAAHVGPAQLAPVYRALRKAHEDAKNEPGAADFYYGEMEMRRHDRARSSRAERSLLHGYWLLSGYGLRASRALGWLAVSAFLTILLLMGFGIPQHAPREEATGTAPPTGGTVRLEISRQDPPNPTGARFTGERFERALNATLNSVVFRSSGQELTTAGGYIEMASRVVEPVLLGLAILAMRNRIRR
ncbi:pentapeptide repeat-containing protein [Streptomyces sp. NPDC048290]|uniref:pentapeptide repeat-containing protein n=1 Tax=Streptomyces sp. NPDC048290 TaxID=3155811 RepID=UPI003421C77E